jgi:hypothetical protein
VLYRFHLRNSFYSGPEMPPSRRIRQK